MSGPHRETPQRRPSSLLHNVCARAKTARAAANGMGGVKACADAGSVAATTATMVKLRIDSRWPVPPDESPCRGESDAAARSLGRPPRLPVSRAARATRPRAPATAVRALTASLRTVNCPPRRTQRCDLRPRRSCQAVDLGAREAVVLAQCDWPARAVRIEHGLPAKPSINALHRAGCARPSAAMTCRSRVADRPRSATSSYPRGRGVLRSPPSPRPMPDPRN